MVRKGQEGQKNCEAICDPKCALWALKEHFNTNPWRPLYTTASQPVYVYFDGTVAREGNATFSFKKGRRNCDRMVQIYLDPWTAQEEH